MFVILISACVAQSTPYQAEIGGQKVTFRANLDRAKGVPLAPDSDALKGLLLSPVVDRIVVAYVPENASNGFYTVTGYEISYKMVLLQRMYYGEAPKIEGMALNTTDEAYRLTGATSPVILMKAGADRTAVTVDGNVVLLEGKDMTEKGRDYTDLDLAADKMLLELLKV